MALFIVSLCVDGNRGIFVGTTACLGFFVSLYGVFAHLSQMLSFRFKVPIGILIFDESQTGCISKINICSSRVELTQAKGSLSSNVMLGYAKYVDVECLGYLVNSVAALSIISNFSTYSLSGCVMLIIKNAIHPDKFSVPLKSSLRSRIRTVPQMDQNDA
jgi:hypothetical protein